MLIIYNTTNNEIIDNQGTLQLHPDGNVPNLPELPDGQTYIKIHDDSDLAKKIMAAEPHSYTLVFDVDGNCIDATVTKTLVEWQAEQPVVIPDPTTEEYLIDLDYRLCMIELGL